MAKPGQLPRWATGATAKTTPEPTEGKKDVGWVAGEKPPEAYQNWWMVRVYQWCQYLDGITNEALTWAAKHTFQGGASSPVMPAAANDLVNKAYADAGADSAKAYGDGLIVALKAAANAWSQRQTFNGGATVPAPVNATDAVTKTYADARETAAKAYGDGLIVALTAAANTWAARQTFNGGATVPAPVNATDAATKAYVDGKTATPGWVNFPASANWATIPGTAAPSYRLLADGTVQFRGRLKILVTQGAFLDLTDMPAGSKPPAGAPVTLLAPYLPAGATAQNWTILSLSNTACTAGTNAMVNDVLLLDGVQYVP